MSLDPRLRRLRQFDDATRAVADLEANVGDAFDRVADQVMPKLTPTNLKTAAYAASLDELVVANGTFPVSLPVATATNAGHQIGVLVKGGTVTVTSQSGVQGGASDALATVGLRRYESTGTDWWRAP